MTRGQRPWSLFVATILVAAGLATALVAGPRPAPARAAAHPTTDSVLAQRQTPLPPLTGDTQTPDSAPAPPATPEPAPVATPLPPPPPSTPTRAVSVAILMYHYIRVNPRADDHLGFELSVTPEHFAAQMDYLRSIGAHTVTLTEVLAAMGGGAPLPPRSVVLTFDDGHDDFATQAAPILASRGFVGISYMVPDFFGHPEYMTPDQVRAVSGMGMVVGAHTMDHVDLQRETATQAAYQIQASRTALQGLTGQPITDFAYPYGHYDARLEAQVRAAGFADAVSTEGGDQQSPDRLYALRRNEVLGDDDLAAFASKAGMPRPGSVPTLAPSPPPSTPSATVQAWFGIAPRPSRLR